MNILKRIKQWWRRRKMFREVDASNKRMSEMSPVMRLQLAEHAREVMFPNGYWICEKHDVIRPNISKGKKCPLCEAGALVIMLLACFCLTGCTVTPIQVKDNVASFDQGVQNSGFYGYDANGYGYISPHARDRYNLLIVDFGKRYQPPLKVDEGITANTPNAVLFDGKKPIGFAPTNAFRIAPEALVNFREMNIWRKSKITK